MEILEILKSHKNDLISEDLELFKTELAVGNYSEHYKEECLEIIERMECLSKSEKTSGSKRNTAASKMSMEIPPLTPANKNAPKISFLEQFKADMNVMRRSKSYKMRFKAYIKSHDAFDESFVDANFNLFEKYEMDAVLSTVQMSEAFLEKYLPLLDKDKIARYQCFSESFYQKHFTDFDAETVLKKGKNAWRKKENRSRQFDVFLRLKGVKE